MCLLIAGKSSQIRATLLNTEGLLIDIFKSNADGVGAMFNVGGLLLTPKVLPKTLGECIAFIESLPDDDRSLALHWRMRTHGNIDLENCHPYTVLDGRIALMHNGVLSQGNKADPTKSDTWHYINDVVRPMLAEAPKMFMNKAWLSLVEYDISSNNRFAIMDNNGDLVILNKHTGVDVQGMWFSNTYAWSPELLIPGYKKQVRGWGSYGMGDDEDWGMFGGRFKSKYPVTTVPTKSAAAQAADEQEDEIVAGPLDITEDEVWDAIRVCDPEQMYLMLEESPQLVLRILMGDCDFVPNPSWVNHPEEYSSRDNAIIKALVDDDMAEVFRFIMMGDVVSKCVAEAICWYGDWVGKPINARDDEDEIVGGVEHQALLSLVKTVVDDQAKTEAEIAAARELAAHNDEVARENALQRELAMAMGANELYSG